mmetsp:Transcript_70220/g.184059  ORF Transcript_70220/g.184059 Transcript_70220/m.184059 type:complete len:514 (+) Transcript_70220:2357-3898(+)
MLGPGLDVREHRLLAERHGAALRGDALLQGGEPLHLVRPVGGVGHEAGLRVVRPQVLDGELEVALLLQQLQAAQALLDDLALGLLRLELEELALLLVLHGGLLLVLPGLLHEPLHLLDLLLVLARVGDAAGLLQQLRPQGVHLRLELGQLLRLLVLRGVDLDRLRALGVVQRGEGLVAVGPRGRAGRHHGGQGVAAQGLLEHAGELGVSVRDEDLLAAPRRHLAEGVDHVPQGRQALVDVRALLEGVALCAGLRRALGARQVHEVDFGEVVVRGVHVVLLVHPHDEQAVRAAARRVHVRGGGGPVLEALVDQLLELLRAVHHDLLQVLHVDAHPLLLSDLQARLRHELPAGDQQVVDDLVVDLQEGALDQELPAVGRQLVDALEEVLRDAGDQPPVVGLPVGHHGVGLPGACLAVGEDCRVVPLEGLVQERHAQLLENLWLRAVRAEDVVEGEGVRPLALHVEVQRTAIGQHLHAVDALAALVDLLLADGPHPYSHSHGGVALLDLLRHGLGA